MSDRNSGSGGINDSLLWTVMRGVMDEAGHEETADQIERRLDEMIPNAVSGSMVDMAALAGASRGLDYTHARRLAGQHQPNAEEPPVVNVTEVEHPDGSVHGIRVLCSDPDARVFIGDGGAVVAVGDHHADIPTRFVPHSVEYEDNDSMTEAIVRAAPALESGDGDVDTGEP